MKGMNEMNHKKFGIGMVVMLTIAVLGLAGCGTASSSTQKKDAIDQVSTEKTTNGKNQTEAEQGYLFKSNGVTIGVDMDMEPIEEALGEPKSIFEQPSCAGQGTAFLYTYSGFEINTYPNGEKNYIAYILLKDDTVATPEGVDLSMTKADIIAAYGENYTEEENKITYGKGNMTLNFFLEGDNIISIEYDSDVLN